MNSSKNLVIALLALTTLGGAMLAWHQYSELVGLRAAAGSVSDRDALQKKIAELQKANRDLEEQLAAMHGAREDGGDDVMANADQAGARDQNGGPRGGRGNRGQQFAAIRDLMNKPEVQAMISAEQKAQLNATYAALFKKLNLTPDQADKLASLLIERQTARQDVFQAARDQGINPRTDPDGFRKLVADAQNSVNDSIKSLLGDDGFSQFTNYEQTMPQRNIVNTLQQRLSYTDSPLTSAQAEQLVQILAANTPQRTTTTTGTEPRGGADFGGGFGGPGGGGFGGFGGRMGGLVTGGFGGGGGGGLGAIVGPNSAPITSGAVSQAQSVLSPTQEAALTQLQQQQQTAQQLQQLVRSTYQQNNPTNGGTATGTGTTGGATTNTGSGGGRRRGGGG